jgi:hypothetical protein
MASKISELIKKSITDKLRDISLSKEVICQHLSFDKQYFCSASKEIGKPERCIYKVKSDLNELNEETKMYCNRCFRLTKDDLSIIYLSKSNHPIVPFTMNKSLDNNETD